MFGARPSVGGTLTLKQCSSLQSASEHAIFIQKIFWGGAPQTSHPVGAGSISRTHPPWLFRQLDPRAFGDLPLGRYSKILKTPLPCCK